MCIERLCALVEVAVVVLVVNVAEVETRVTSITLVVYKVSRRSRLPGVLLCVLPLSFVRVIYTSVAMNRRTRNKRATCRPLLERRL